MPILLRGSLGCSESSVCAVKLKNSSLTSCNKDDTIPKSAKRDEVSVTLYRRSYQTALRCKSRKTAVVNGQRKGSEDESGKTSRDECK